MKYKKREFHGLSKHPLYNIWASIKQRCTNPKSAGYKLYGARGITMQPEWVTSFATFLEDVGERPHGSSIDRIDNNKGYVRGNIRWATPQEQSNNTRTNRYVTVDGVTKTLAQWARELNISYRLLRSRLDRGVTPPELFQVKAMPTKTATFYVEVNGQLMTIKEAVLHTGLSRSTLYYRYRKEK
jgi:hypothetical protein